MSLSLAEIDILKRTSFSLSSVLFNKGTSLKEDGWYESKRYLHFDEPISKDEAFKLVSNPKRILKHAFFPFISFTISSPKYVYDDIKNKMVQKPKNRDICYCSHKDSHIYSYYAKKLNIMYEQYLIKKGLEKNIIAFRSINGKCNIDFAREAFKNIQEYEQCKVIALDFSNFFGTLDHKILKNNWSRILDEVNLPDDHYKLFKSLTNFSLVKKEDLDNLLARKKGEYYSKICTIDEFRNKIRKNNLIQKNIDNGIPQGSPISGLLSNIYMIDFDELINSYVQKLNGKYYRYCDDMLIIIPQIDLELEVKSLVLKLVQELKVTLNDKKTEIRTFIKADNILKTIENKPLQYLGFIFDGENIYIRSSSISRYHSKMKKGIYRAKFHMKKKNQEKKIKGYQPKGLFKNKLYERYSHLGESNFTTYSLRAKEKMDNSTSIKKQIKKFHKKLNKRLK